MLTIKIKMVQKEKKKKDRTSLKVHFCSSKDTGMKMKRQVAC